MVSFKYVGAPISNNVLTKYNRIWIYQRFI